jgi:hypothetical protein
VGIEGEGAGLLYNARRRNARLHVALQGTRAQLPRRPTHSLSSNETLVCWAWLRAGQVPKIAGRRMPFACLLVLRCQCPKLKRSARIEKDGLAASEDSKDADVEDLNGNPPCAQSQSSEVGWVG